VQIEKCKMKEKDLLGKAGGLVKIVAKSIITAKGKEKNRCYHLGVCF